MQDNVAFEVKQERLQRLNEKTNGYARQNNEKYVGKIVKVLVDGPSKKNKTVLSGYSEAQKLVNFVGDETVKIGDIVDVRITEAKSWSLNGELVKE